MVTPSVSGWRRRTSGQAFTSLLGLVSLCLLLSASSAAAASGAPPPHPARTSVQTALGQLPLVFVENRGQLDSRVAYYVQGHDKMVYFTPQGLTLALRDDRLLQAGQGLSERIEWQADAAGAEAKARPTSGRWVVTLDFVDGQAVRPEGVDKTPSVVSIFKGGPSEWRTGLPTFAGLVYHDVWPGIDLVYSGTVNALKYSFIVRPGADPAQIRLRYRGATSVTVGREGRLAVTTPAGGFEDAAPVSYQAKGGHDVAVPTAYQVEGDAASGVAYGFRLGDYDKGQPLVIDPTVFLYAGYIGGAGEDRAYGVTVDSSGNAYVTGVTVSTDASFPTTVGPDLTFNGGNSDAFVAKVRADGTGLVYLGYIGGSGEEVGRGIAVDAAGNAVVAGYTYSSQATFPVVVGPDLTFNGDRDAFVAKVRADGTGLIYAGYIGGAAIDVGRGVALDPAGNAYVAGYTTSTQASFPVLVGPDLTSNGDIDGFVAKVKADGTGLLYAGYIGGSGVDPSEGIAVDSAGSAYLTGYTNSSQSTFPVAVGPDLTYNGGGDSYIVKVRADGTGLAYAGYIGGTAYDEAFGVAVDSSGSAYVAGYTASDQASFPVAVGPDLTFGSGLSGQPYDGFIAKVAANGASFVYAGYIGGNGVDVAEGVAVDSAGAAYVTGFTGSPESSFPVTNGPDLTANGAGDAYLVKVAPGGGTFASAGFIGGSGYDEGYSVAVDSAGAAYVVGWTGSNQNTFPVLGGPDLTYNGGPNDNPYDVFVAKVGQGQLHVIHGRITLQGRQQHDGIQVVVGNQGTLTDEAGEFTLLVSPGQYQLTASHSLYLPQCLTAHVSAADVTLPTVQLLGGDINGDGVIGIADLVAVGNAYNASVPRGVAPDVDASGKVDLPDLLMVGLNYNIQAAELPCVGPQPPALQGQADDQAKVAPRAALVVGAPVEVKAGEEFVVQVGVRDGQNVAAADVRLRFDPTRLALVENAAQVGPFFDPAQAFIARNTGDAARGEWAFTAARLGPSPAKASAVLFSLRLRALESGPPRLEVQADFAEPSGQTLSLSWER